MRSAPPNLLVDLPYERFECHRLECGIVQISVYDLLVLIHSVDHQPFDLRFHRQLEVVELVRKRPPDHLLILFRLSDELVEE